jgi:hypothetical protein
MFDHSYTVTASLLQVIGFGLLGLYLLRWLYFRGFRAGRLYAKVSPLVQKAEIECEGAQTRAEIDAMMLETLQRIDKVQRRGLPQ